MTTRASHSRSPSLQIESDIGNQWASPPDSPLPLDDQEAQARRLLKGKGREPAIVDQHTSYPPQSDTDHETNAVEQTLAAWAASEKQKRATVRKASTLISSPPQSITLSDISRKSSTLVKRATLSRSLSSTRRATESARQNTELQPLPSLPQSSRPFKTLPETAEEYEVNLPQDPTSNIIPNKLYHTESRSYAETAATDDDFQSVASDETVTQHAPDDNVEELTDRALKTGSRFVEDLSSQSMQGHDPNLARKDAGQTKPRRLPWSRRSTDSGSATPKAGLKQQYSTSRTSVDTIDPIYNVLATTQMDDRRAGSRSSFATDGGPPTPGSYASNSMFMGVHGDSSFDLSGQASHYFPTSTSTRQLIDRPDSGGDWTSSDRRQRQDRSSATETDQLVSPTFDRTHELRNGPLYSLANWCEYVCCLGCLRGSEDDDEYQTGRTMPSE